MPKLSLFDRGALVCGADCYLPNPFDLPGTSPEFNAAYQKAMMYGRGAAAAGVAVLAWAGALLGTGAGAPLARAIQAGLVNPAGKLGQVLGGVESGFGAAAPKTAMDALTVVRNATSAVGLEPGIASIGKAGQIILQNVGGVTTTLGANGSILVQRGADVLLHLIP